MMFANIPGQLYIIEYRIVKNQGAFYKNEIVKLLDCLSPPVARVSL
jgi:hypothetical protein